MHKKLCSILSEIRSQQDPKTEVTFTFSRRFYPKRLTRMYTHFTFTLMAHCTSGAIKGSVSCSKTLRRGIKLATLRLLNNFSTSCTTVAHQNWPMTCQYVVGLQ